MKIDVLVAGVVVATVDADTLEDVSLAVHVSAVQARLDRLCEGHTISVARREALTSALEAGASEEVVVALRDARRIAKRSTIVLPPHRLSGLSRGKGWARKGRGSNVVWGEKVDGGYEADPGHWVVGGNDGFSRKGEDEWLVEHVKVGDNVWTIAN